MTGNPLPTSQDRLVVAGDPSDVGPRWGAQPALPLQSPRIQAPTQVLEGQQTQVAEGLTLSWGDR